MRAAWIRPELVVGLTMASLAGVASLATAGIDAKYKMAAVLALAGSAVLTALPERRIACVLLWLLIHPLGVEKVFFIEAAESPLFLNPAIAINASDGPLLLLALFLLSETALRGRMAFRWSRLATILLLYLAWSVISYEIHAQYLDDGFVTSAPLTLLQDVRLLVFIVLIQSAIRTRGDVLLTLFAMAGAVALQVGFIAASYATGSLLTYAAAVGDSVGLQKFGTSGEAELSRASGTVGQINEQAQYHVFMTIPVLAFFGARNRAIRFASLAVIAGSALALVLTFSRGAWLAFPFGLLVSGVIAFRRRLMGRSAALVGASCALGGAVALVFLAQPIYQRLAYGDDGATDSRLRMLQLAVDLFETAPLIGVGPGEYVEAALRLYPPRYDESEWVRPGERLPFPGPRIGRVEIAQIILEGYHVRRPLPVHNKYMLTLSELGIPGLLLWLWFYAAFVAAALRASKSPDLLLQLTGIAGVGVAASELLYMQVDLFHEDKPLEFMLFAPALMAAVARVVQSAPPLRLGPG